MSLALIMLSFSHLLKFILRDFSFLIFTQTQPGVSQDTIEGLYRLIKYKPETKHLLTEYVMVLVHVYINM